MSFSNTIYHCLTNSFWTQRKCWQCQRRFTNQDCQIQNYRLSFQEILSIWEHPEFPLPQDNAWLEGVIARLFHRQCPYSKTLSYQQEITCKPFRK